MVTIGTPRIAGQTYAGGSVRYRPSGEITAARALNQAELLRKITPSQDPIADVIAATQAVPSNRMIITQQSQELPIGSDRPYEWLKNRAESKSAYRFADRPLVISDAPRLLDDGVRGALFEAEKAQKLGIDIAVNPNQTPYQKMDSLAHELSHSALAHQDMRGYLDRGQMETEAQTAAYGIVNRMYPWNKTQLANTGLYNQSIQHELVAQNMMAKMMAGGEVDLKTAAGKNLLDPVAYLQDDDGARHFINGAINNIVPNPRKPFRNITPQVYGMNTSPTRNLNLVAQAHQQEELMAQAALADRYARYGY